MVINPLSANMSN